MRFAPVLANRASIAIILNRGAVNNHQTTLCAEIVWRTLEGLLSHSRLFLHHPQQWFGTPINAWMRGSVDRFSPTPRPAPDSVRGDVTSLESFTHVIELRLAKAAHVATSRVGHLLACANLHEMLCDNRREPLKMARTVFCAGS